jgi:phage I-like protein
MKTKNLILIGTANELKVVNNVLKIPFGSYDHLQGLQIFGLADASACVEAFNEQAKIAGFRGLPVYIGHPDVKAFQDKYRDHAAYGWITAMIANEADSRLEMTVEWTAPGEQLIANEQFAYFSPLWLSVKKAGNVHPFKIKSVGLTQEPNIQFLAIACEEEQTTEGDPMNPLLEKLKLLLPEADREQITTEELLIAALEKMLADKKEPVADPAVAAAANELPGVKATLTETANQLFLANESLAALRGAHSKLLLDGALQDGRITPATRAKWEERFGAPGADCLALANELGSIDPVMKTTRITQGAKPGDNGGATHADVIALANEMCGDGKTSFETAYASAKKDPRFAHLFQVK